MTIVHALTREVEVVGRASTGEGVIAVQLPNRLGSRVIELSGDELLAQFVAEDALLLFTLADFGGEDTLFIYLINAEGKIEETVKLFHAYTNCVLKILDVGDQILFSFFNTSVEYSLQLISNTKVQIMPNVTGVYRENGLAMRSRLVLNERVVKTRDADD